jgi:hypothetical protein
MEMGRTIPSFRIVLKIEKEEWKPFRNALDKKERKAFDEMWDIPRLYITACSMILFSLYRYIQFHFYTLSPLQTANGTEGTS